MNGTDTQLFDVTFEPAGVTITVPTGSLLTVAMRQAGIFLPLDCGGKGTCGCCQVIVTGPCSPPDPAEQKILDPIRLSHGWRLACRTKVLGCVTVQTPLTADSSQTTWRIDRQDIYSAPVTYPVITTVACSFAAPTLADTRSDLKRLTTTLTETKGNGHIEADHHTAAQISRLARQTNWQLSCYLRNGELVGVAGRDDVPLGLAVDLGSTKLAAYLTDLTTGTVIASRGKVNPQVIFGADVVTRLQRAMKNPDDAQQQTTLIRHAINELAGALADQAGMARNQICEMSIAGNSVMMHLLLALPLAQLGAPPFVSCFDQATSIKARELDIAIAPGACIYLPPLIGGYVGSDNTAMIIGAHLDHPGPCRLALDIGTNTEVVLAVPGGPLYIASAPSGPTFEGAHLSSGMRALTGAISSCRLEGDSVHVTTVDGSPPAGICGSGIIDIIAELLQAGVINGRGHLDRTHPRVRVNDRRIEFLLVPADTSATGLDIMLSQEDISQIQLAKAAINGACTTLLSQAGLGSDAIEEVILAGSFGSHINVNNARKIGLVPNHGESLWKQVGNGAGRGIQQLLNDTTARARATTIPDIASYVELSGQASFNSLFAKSLAFPTDS